MTENLQIDRSEINKFILDAAIKKDPVFDSYKKLCKVQESQKIDYVDFEWKYYQFYHGNRDLTIERSPDNSSSLTFSDLPIDSLEVIVGNVPLIERLVLRKVSHDLRNLVDSAEIHSKKLHFQFRTDGFHLYESATQFLDGMWDLIYHQDDDGCSVVSDRYFNQKTKKVKEDRSAVMTTDYSTFLKNPKLKIDLLVIVGKGVKYPAFLELLQSLNHRLDVQTVHLETNNEKVLPVLLSLKPNTLEEISIFNYDVTADEWDDIMETDQWKMAKKLYLYRIPEGFRIENMHHFKTINITGFQFTDENVIMIRDVLLKSPHLELCHMGNFGDWEDEEERIDEILSQDPAYDSETRRFSISNSSEYFQLKFEDASVFLNITRHPEKEKRFTRAFITNATMFEIFN